MRAWLIRHSFGLAVSGLGAVIVVGAGFILLVALPQLFGDTNGGQLPGTSASPSPSPPLGVMSWVGMPVDADCSACHLTAGGGVGLKPVPSMAHPISGWTDCTACHATDRLVAVAPGHAGIHGSECLLCHQPQTLPPALSRPHRDRQNQDCLDCHGKQAPLPSDMAHRPDNVCWLCHRLPDEQPPLPAHPTQPDQTNCLACHTAGGPPGPLPTDHAGRTAAECLLCHAPATPSPAAPSVPPAPTPSAVPNGYVLLYLLQ